MQEKITRSIDGLQASYQQEQAKSQIRTLRIYNDPERLRAQMLEHANRAFFPILLTPSELERKAHMLTKSLGFRTVEIKEHRGVISLHDSSIKKTERIHADIQNRCLTAVTYLTPNPSIDSGTLFWQHLDTGVLKNNDERVVNMDKVDFAFPRAWDCYHRTENIYGNTTVFPGEFYHSSGNSFGHNKTNGRLVETIEFKVIK